MQLVGAAPAPQGVGLGRLPGTVNYFLGNDPARWHTGIATYARVEFRDVYAGIDLAYYGNQGQLEYDFVVAPGASPGAIRLAFAGADKVEVDARGDLVLHGPGGDLLQHKPFLYQDVNGVRQEVGGGYVLQGRGQVGFHASAYDPRLPLVIDPVIAFSSYVGSTVLGPPGPSSSRAVGVDGAGNIYLTGTTNTGFGPGDAFVMAADPTLSVPLYLDFFGGPGPGPAANIGYGLAVDPAGFAYVTGKTTSPAFPTTVGPPFGGPFSDGFVVELDPSGVLLSSSYLAGPAFGPFPHAGYGIALSPTGDAFVAGTTNTGAGPPGPSAALVADVPPGGAPAAYFLLGGPPPSVSVAYGVAVDPAGEVYVTGTTSSPAFPITPGVFMPAFGGPTSDGFVAELDPFSGALVYSSYLAGPGFGPFPHAGYGIAVGPGGDAFVTGTTNTGAGPPGPSAALVAHVAPGGGGLLYGALLGGPPPSTSVGYAIAADAAGDAYLTGVTTSPAFPLAAPFDPVFSPPSDAFVTELDPTGTLLLSSSYLGGPGADAGYGLAVDPGGTVYVTGTTSSPAFPTTPGTFMPVYAPVDPTEGFVTVIV
jgi:hypothetical protein